MTVPTNTVRKNYIQEEDVRRYVGDNEQHDLLGGFAFSSEDIQAAMRFCVMAYNEIPPHGFEVLVDTMPFSSTFLDGIGHQLFQAKVNQLSHELLQYQVGSVAYTDKETRIKAYEKRSKEFYDKFMASALNIKRRQNLEEGYAECLSPYSGGFW